MAWLTPEELRLHLRLDSIDEAIAAGVIEDAETLIRGELEQHIDPVPDDETVLVGTGSAVLVLPEMPTTAVTTVTVNGGQLLVEEQDYRWDRHGILTRAAGVWETGTNVTVVYDHGYAVLPPSIKRVCKQLAGRAYVTDPGRQLASESIGDWSGTYARDSAGNTVSGQALTAHEVKQLGAFSRGCRSR